MNPQEEKRALTFSSVVFLFKFPTKTVLFGS